MNKNFNTNTENNDVWLTPPYIIQALGVFDLDPCAALNMPWTTANKHFTIHDNGLCQEWKGRVWCNPPYGREAFKWLNKLSKHGNGIALIFARTETIGFHNEIWNKADAIFFFKGRLKFHYPNGREGNSANAPSCLVAYGESNVTALDQCKLKGKLILLNQN